MRLNCINSMKAYTLPWSFFKGFNMDIHLALIFFIKVFPLISMIWTRFFFNFKMSFKQVIDLTIFRFIVNELIRELKAKFDKRWIVRLIYEQHNKHLEKRQHLLIFILLFFKFLPFGYIHSTYQNALTFLSCIYNNFNKIILTPNIPTTFSTQANKSASNELNELYDIHNHIAFFNIHKFIKNPIILNQCIFKLLGSFKSTISLHKDSQDNMGWSNATTWNKLLIKTYFWFLSLASIFILINLNWTKIF